MKMIQSSVPLPFDDDNISVQYYRQMALLNLLAKQPSNEQIQTLCHQWGIEPIYFGSTRIVNRLASIAVMSQYVIGLGYATE